MYRIMNDQTHGNGQKNMSTMKSTWQYTSLLNSSRLLSLRSHHRHWLTLPWSRRIRYVLQVFGLKVHRWFREKQTWTSLNVLKISNWENKTRWIGIYLDESWYRWVTCKFGRLHYTCRCCLRLQKILTCSTCFMTTDQQLNLLLRFTNYLRDWTSSVAFRAHLSHHLVGGWALPLWKIWGPQLGWWHSQYFWKDLKVMFH